MEEADTLSSHELKGGRLGEHYLKNFVCKPKPIKYCGGINLDILFI
jgi:hypothetical protein